MPTSCTRWPRSSPSTKEVVETFPLSVSAHAKFNAFRLQPSKGVTFGAVRFDSAPRTKRVELRNEGQFDLTYVVCSKLAETDEIDTLDDAAYAAFARGVPPAARPAMLGGGYMERLAKAGVKCDPQAPSLASRPPSQASSKPDPKAAAAAPVAPKLIFDPDGIPECKVPENALTVGAFSVKPLVAVVQPGQVVGIDVTFDPAGCDSAKERLRFVVSGVDPDDNLTRTVASFDLSGDSCFPAITVEDTTGIFEEQEVVNSLTDLVGGNDGDVGSKLDKLAVGKVVYAEKEKILAFGPIMCGQPGTRGVMERVRITNPTKIDTRVSFRVLSEDETKELLSGGSGTAAAAAAAAAPAKGKDAKAAKGAPPVAAAAVKAEGPFTCQPEVWDIPAHEYRYVTIYFSPTEIKSYRGAFVAEIDDEGSTSTATRKPVPGAGRRLFFELGGSGTMPCITIEEPTARGADGALAMDFGKVHVDRVSNKAFCLRNHGCMAATCLFEYQGSNDFRFSSRNASLTLQPGQKGDLSVSFAPRTVVEDGTCEATIRVSVLNNQFDQYTLKLGGVAYACDAMIDTDFGEHDGGDSAVDAAMSFLNNQLSVDKSLDKSLVAEGRSGAGIRGLLAPSTTKGEAQLAGKRAQDDFTIPEINLAVLNVTAALLPEGEVPAPMSSTYTVLLRSRAAHPLKFKFAAEESSLSFTPAVGHLGGFGTREVVVTFTAKDPTKLEKVPVTCTLQQIAYPEPKAVEDGQEGSGEPSEPSAEPLDAATLALQGAWDDAMKAIRPATEEDLAALAEFETEMAAYAVKLAEQNAEIAKGKKPKAMLGPPPSLALQMAPVSSQEGPMVYELVAEPSYEAVADRPEQTVTVTCTAVADHARYKCEGHGENINFRPTYMLQSTVHRFSMSNESNVALPVKWSLDDIKRRGTAAARLGTAASRVRTPGPAIAANLPCPFSIEPETLTIPPNSSAEFKVSFLPLDADEFVFLLKGETPPVAVAEAVEGATAPADGIGPADAGAVRMVLRGTAKRPVCHFELKETPDYLSRRAGNLKNENGMLSPIECTDLKVVEVESTGLRTRNTFRFHIINPTADNFDFLWEAVGEPSPFWRCLQSAGMLFAGKRIEMVFEYLPDEVAIAETFFKFKLVQAGLEQMFLFAGKVAEPKVFFSTSKVDFHSMVLSGEGNSETVYLENREHLPFQFQFDRTTLLQLEGTTGPIVDISPKSGTVLPQSRTAIVLSFRPQEEVMYNFNVLCDVKRKPNKLSLNIKGEGYAVHPVIQLETDEGDNAGPSGFAVLRPAPAVNYVDFGAVQVHDTLKKKLTVTNNGKYNFDYMWETDSMGAMLALSGGKMGGTLQKAGQMEYTLTFSPQREGALDGSSITFTVAGKYTYTLAPRGSGVTPALRFSFMSYDFGSCFVTSPGGSTVIEEAVLRITNHDPSSNIAIECTFQKTRALWVDCPPTMVEPGAVLEVRICFAPREVKDYAFAVPFVVNGTGKLNVNIVGRGAMARLEMANPSQRKIAFGVVSVGSENRKVVPLVNRSKRAMSVQLIDEGQYGVGPLGSNCVEFYPRHEVTVGPRETLNVQVAFAPDKRVGNFAEELLIRYAGLTRKLLTVSGKAQGTEVALDADSLPFGAVVADSQKVKKLVLENSGDLPISYQWMESSFGPHFAIAPLAGKLAPGTEVAFDVTFHPAFLDDDIRQDNMMLVIPGQAPLTLTCTGMCIPQPDGSAELLEWKGGPVRKEDPKKVPISNPTDKDWFLSPNLKGENWRVAHEVKIPAKGSADLVITYFPLTMCPAPSGGASAAAAAKSGKGAPPPAAEGTPAVDVPAHRGQLFLALPDGSARLFELKGYAEKPDVAANLVVESAAKKSATTMANLTNWLGVPQRFDVTVDLTDKPSPATFVVVSNVIEVGANGSKDFPVRFVSYVEGTTKGTITCTNRETGEYVVYTLKAVTTAADVLETIEIESPVRQTARYVIGVENPLLPDVPVAMGTAAKPAEWWTCDSPYVRVNELTPMAGNPEGSFEVEYRPLLLTDKPVEVDMTIISRDLGVFKYKLRLTTSPPALRQTLRFEVPLGSVQTEAFTFRAYNTAKTEYACATKAGDKSMFAVAKTLGVDAASGWDGDDARLAVTFEPTEIGSVRDTLTVTSPVGGEYVCDLVATCVPPLPQGPFAFTKGGGAVDIPFRNCFPAQCNWSFAVDSPAFKVNATSATVGPKSEGKCAVSFDPQGDALAAPGGVVNAKLFVTCTSKPEVPPWVFYLRGNVGTPAAVAAASAADAPKKK